MNNEPVVWTACLDCGKRVTGDSIHTCSPQIKDLTDEEVKEIVAKHIHMTLSGERFGYLEFARAILKKASEK
jgi:hypothetical protein